MDKMREEKREKTANKLKHPTQKISYQKRTIFRLVKDKILLLLPWNGKSIVPLRERWSQRGRRGEGEEVERRKEAEQTLPLVVLFQSDVLFRVVWELEGIEGGTMDGWVDLGFRVFLMKGITVILGGLSMYWELIFLLVMFRWIPKKVFHHLGISCPFTHWYAILPKK